MKRPDVIWLERNESERIFIGRSTRKARTSIVEGDCGGCVETTRTAKNLILSETKNFCSHVKARDRKR
jgi:Fe-S cluster biogenesis protein NfuA